MVAVGHENIAMCRFQDILLSGCGRLWLIFGEWCIMRLIWNLQDACIGANIS